jgi:MFS family permease
MVVNTAASVFQAPPYNMTPGIQSLIFVPGILGAALGAYMGGALTDKFIEYRTKNNNGIFEPETRLVALIFPLFIVPAGVLMYVHYGHDD